MSMLQVWSTHWFRPALWLLVFGGAIGNSFSPSDAQAQGVLILTGEGIPLPRPFPPIMIVPPTPLPQPVRPTYAVKEVAISATVRDQLATVLVQQVFVNTGSVQGEAQFVLPIPPDSVVDGLTLMIDGKEFPAQILKKEEARARYEAIVRTNRDPALLEWMGWGLIQTSVFPLPAGATRRVDLQYSSLLRKEGDAVDLLIPLAGARFTAKPVEKLSVKVQISATQDIKNLFSSSHPVDVVRPDARTAVVSWTGSSESSAADFRLIYDTNPADVGISLLTYRPDKDDEGYFLLLASPKFEVAAAQRPRKTIQFVLDQSGSMTGAKMEQARGALRFVLNNLNEGDLFNIVAYQSTVQQFRPELEVYNPTTRQAALGYVDSLYAGGGTNIHDALTTALKPLTDKTAPSYVLFLTDGLPTIGEQREPAIAAAARQANVVRARLLTFGVGYDVNSRLLDRLARDNFGASEYVRPNEDIEASVSRVFGKINSPVLTNVQLRVLQPGMSAQLTSNTSRVYPSGEVDLFTGEQLVLVGRYLQSGPATVLLHGVAAGEPKTYEFSPTLAEPQSDSTNAFIARLWATRRIGQIIDELDLNGKNAELLTELTNLATKYGVLTPYTSFLADENARPSSLALGNADSYREVETQVDRLAETAGRDAVELRAAKGFLQRARAASGPMIAGSVIAGQPGAPANSVSGLRAKVEDTVRQSSAAAVYRRGKLVLQQETAEIDLERDKAQIEQITRFSEAYFELVRLNTQDENQLLSLQQPGEQLLIKLRGQVYLID